MKGKYLENIFKELHYNSGLSSFTHSLVPAAMAVCIICGKDVMEAFKVQTVSNDQKEVALVAIERGQTPPENPVKIVVHTSTSSTTSLPQIPTCLWFPKLTALKNCKVLLYWRKQRRL